MKKKKTITDGLCETIVRRFLSTRYGKRLQRGMKETLCSLSPLERPQEVVLRYYVGQLKSIGAVLLLGMVLGLILLIQKGTQENGHTITEAVRGEYGEGENVQQLELSIDGILQKEPLELHIAERVFTKKELEGMLKKEAEQLEKRILAENDSLDEVTSDLHLPVSITGTPIRIVWQISDPMLIAADGTLQTEHLPQSGQVVELQATLQAEEEILIHKIYVVVRQPKRSEEEEKIQAVKDTIERLDRANASSHVLPLPKIVDGMQISFRSPDSYRSLLLAFPLGLVLVLILASRGKRSSIEREYRQRERQLSMDYPEIISKLTLMFGAGMPIVEAWSRIVMEYARRREQGAPMRYAYEEMLVTYRELNSGRSQEESYDRFGRRCRLSSYTKLSMLLIQNLHKGSGGLREMLSYEAVQALEERRQLAKRLGEETATKLLIPMVLMLGVVLVILMVPAFLSMNVS